MRHQGPTGLAAALGAAALLAACSQGEATSAEDLSGVELTVAVQNSGNSATLEILRASGVLEDTPYEVEIAEFDGAGSTVEALNAGAVDVSIALNSSAPVLSQANSPREWTEEDAPFRVVGAVERPEDSGIAVVVGEDADITSVADLRGRSVSFAPGTAQHYFFALAARAEGVDLKDVEIIEMPLSEARAAFIGGSVDALVTSVTNARPLVRENDSVILTDSQGAFTNYQFVVATQDALRDEARSAAIGDLIERLQRNEEWQGENLEEVTAIYEDVADQPREDAELTAVENVGRFVPIDEEVFATQQDQADTFYDEGVTGSEVDVRIAFDDRYDDLVEAQR